MSEEPKKWKRGDIGPDGRVFWQYHKQCKNGEWWCNMEDFASKVKIMREKNRRYLQNNKEQAKKSRREWIRLNPDRFNEHCRRTNLRKSFKKQDGSSFKAWTRSVSQMAHTSCAISRLQPDPGQTLAELIYELSGYTMEVCELIANPPPVEEPTPEKLDNPAPPSTLLGGPDLF